jgi:AcrR family transcriptional regulator
VSSGSETVAEPAKPAAGKRSARDRILDAAIDRIASDGIDEVRIARIAMDAGVSTSLVHYHFSTREALLGEALEHSYEKAGSARIGEGDDADKSPVERLADVIDGSLPYPGMLEQDWILWVELWLRAARSPELRATSARLYGRMHEWMRDEIAAGIAAGAFRDVDPAPVADRALALVDGFGIRVLVGDPEVSLDRAREEVWWLLSTELGIDEEIPPRRDPERA